MIRRNQRLLNCISIFIDFLLVISAYVLATWLWLDYMGGRHDNIAALSEKTIVLSAVYAVILLFGLAVSGFYSTTRTRRVIWKIRTIFTVAFITILLATTTLYFLHLAEFSRGVLVCFFVFTLILLCVKYVAMRLVLNWMRAHGYNLKHVVIFGTGEAANQFAQNVARDRSLGMHVVGFIGASDHGQANYLGNYSQAEELLSAPMINEAVIALEPSEYLHVFDLIAACDINGVKYYIIPLYNDIIPAQPVIEMIGNSKLIGMSTNRLDNIGWAIIKRTFDLIVSGIGLIVLSPLLLIIAISVKISSPGPILFKQVRVGYERREFQMLKFRSMRVNSEEDTAWTTNADQRRTALGQILRKSSLDELPQLWNVFKGDMSLVGPRPEIPHFVDIFKKTIPLYMVKHQVRPGITGWAQIHGYRGDTSIPKRIELDLWYINHWSPGLDILILLRTVFGGMFNKEKLSRGQ